MNPQVQIKLLNENAKLPTKANESDAYYDVVATSINHTERYIEYGLGFSSEFSEDMICHIFPRSSISNYDLIMANAPGTIDSSYRGEWKVRFKLTPPNFIFFDTNEEMESTYVPKIYQVGDKIAQIGFRLKKDVEWIETTALSDTERGDGGFGSTGT